MKISEQVERECCDWVKDLVLYKGSRYSPSSYPDVLHFCKHCGQVWKPAKKIGFAGSVKKDEFEKICL